MFFIKYVQQPSLLTPREKEDVDTAPMAGQFVEFQSNFEFKIIRSFETYRFDESFLTELVMVHNNIGFAWQMVIYKFKDIDCSEGRSIAFSGFCAVKEVYIRNWKTLNIRSSRGTGMFLDVAGLSTPFKHQRFTKKEYGMQIHCVWA